MLILFVSELQYYLTKEVSSSRLFSSPPSEVKTCTLCDGSIAPMLPKPCRLHFTPSVCWSGSVFWGFFYTFSTLFSQYNRVFLKGQKAVRILQWHFSLFCFVCFEIFIESGMVQMSIFCTGACFLVSIFRVKANSLATVVWELMHSNWPLLCPYFWNVFHSICT